MSSGLKPVWAGRNMRLDPFRLPQVVSYASRDDVGEVIFSIDRRGAVIRRKLTMCGLPVTIMLIPIEIMGMFVRPFALTMRLAANMTGGHIAILAILSFVFIFTELSGQALVGIGVGVPSLVLAALLMALEIIVVAVQAYVFTLLSAVFIGMAIHAHH